MAFGKRKTNWSNPGRIFWGERGETNGSHNGGSTRNGLLEPGEDHPMEQAEDESPLAADPTQRLLTCLGRFQRQVSKADSGAAADEWTDECMGQIISGIEIAHENDWASVQEALTDTARVLQSYEDADSPEAAIPFLQDAYEILCLMVGDIIVDNVRSGVVVKWRQRFQRAVQELSTAGIALVDDDGSASESAMVAAPLSAFEQTEADDDDPELWNVADEDTQDDTTTFEPWNEQAAEETSPFEAAPWEELSDDEALHEEVEDLMEEARAEGSSAIDSGTMVWDFDAKDNASFGAEETGTPDDMGVTDLLAEAFPEQTAPEVRAMHVVEDLEELEDEIDDKLEEFEAEAPAPVVEELDLFSAMELETPAPAPEAIVPAPEVTEPPVAEAPSVAVAAASAPADGSPEALMLTMQQAMASGNVTDAKSMALRLAAAMAQMEVVKAEENVRIAQERLFSNAEEIGAGENAVAEAEARVRQTESQVAAREQEAEQFRGQINTLQLEMTTISEAMAAIQAQIRELQQRLEAEQQQHDALQAKLDEETSAQGRVQSELETLTETEQEERHELDAARVHVTLLQKERESREKAVAQAEAALQTQKISAEDIVRTLGVS